MRRYEEPQTTGGQTLSQRLGQIVQRRAELLAHETKLWADLAAVITEWPSLLEPTRETVVQQQDRNPVPARELLTVADAGEYLGISPNALGKWRVTGGGPEYVRLGRRIRYQRSVLEAFVAARKYPHTSAYGVDKTGSSRSRRE